MFSYNGPMARLVYSLAAIEHDKHNSRDSNQILLNNKDQQVLTVSCTLGAKSAIYYCVLYFFLHSSLWQALGMD